MARCYLLPVMHVPLLLTEYRHHHHILLLHAGGFEAGAGHETSCAYMMDCNWLWAPGRVNLTQVLSIISLVLIFATSRAKAISGIGVELVVHTIRRLLYEQLPTESLSVNQTRPPPYVYWNYCHSGFVPARQINNINYHWPSRSEGNHFSPYIW